MRFELIKNKFLIILFLFPLTYIIGIAIVESFILLFLLLLGVNYKSISLPDRKILLFFLLFSLLLGANAFLQITDNLKYSSIFHFRYVLFSIAVFYFFEKYFNTKLDKKVSIYITSLENLGLIDEDNINLETGEKSMKLTISDLGGEDYILEIPNLNSEIRKGKTKLIKAKNKLIVSLFKSEEFSWYDLRKE